jgi:hypothetical protein
MKKPSEGLAPVLPALPGRDALAQRADEYAFALSETEAPGLKAPETPKH